MKMIASAGSTSSGHQALKFRSLASGSFSDECIGIKSASTLEKSSQYYDFCKDDPSLDGSAVSTVSTRSLSSSDSSLTLQMGSSISSCCGGFVENDHVPRSDPDLYGQRHPIESPEILERKMEQFEIEVQNLLKNSQALQTAQKRCSYLLTDSFKLQFLRCECFDAVKSAQRYCKYWEKRLEIFGEDRAFAKLTAASMQEDWLPIQKGALQVIRRPKTEGASPDSDERDILYMDSSKLEPGAYTRESGCRAFWYLFHCLLEDEQVQKRGLIVLGFSANFQNRNRDSVFTRMCLASMQGCLPIRLSAFHVCHSPIVFHFVAKMLLCFIGERLRKRVLPHAGKYDKVVETLGQKYFLQKNFIPTDMGGDLILNQQAWLDERLASGL